MKLKTIVAACAALCTVSAFAATLDPTTQAPQLTFYVGGSSAQSAAVTAVAPDLFDQSAITMIKITQSGGEAATGFYGMSKATLTGTSQRLLVVYNSTNGSAAGVEQLISKPSAPVAPDSDVLTVGTSACTAVVANASTCTSHAYTPISMALSDVNMPELVNGVLSTGPDYYTQAQLTITKTALQGFGVIVNPALYTALQRQNNREGLLSAACIGTISAACQPSIRRADYASLVNAEGTIKSAAQLLGDAADVTDINLYRRDDPSGTQASSNIFFGNNVCGTLGFQGALTPLDNFGSNPGVLDITLQTGTGAVKTGVGTSAGYGIGVISMGNAEGSTWRYVKLDGVSPNYNPDGTADANLRNAFASGRYPFAMEMYAMYVTSAPTVTKNLASTMVTGLKDSTKHNLLGIAYLDGLPYTIGGKESYVNRGGNNCQPLIN